jgi:multiple sugar transport system permease protein
MTVASTSPPLRRPRGDGALAALFVAPAMLGFLVFLLWPTLRGVYLSFTRFNLLTPAEWVGLDNYIRMVNDPIFWDSLTVTVEYVAINIGVQTVSALAIAVRRQSVGYTP